MTYRGTVRNGVVVLDEPGKLRDGAKVDVVLVDTPHQPSPDSNGTPSVFDQLQDLVGTVTGLPSDLPENHDHYLYGTRKK
jgi:hypothetical protein